ncbi:MAG: ABC transporter ATP-binding protein [Deltaproteobacteria bacterium]|nr:ABC transporter ATP-binding protein [Deltaproteobacteria bacterium]
MTAALAPVAAARGLRHAWAGSSALVDVDVEVCAGRITGFLGRNGAGKSTTLRILAGVVVPDGGTVVVGGWSAHDPRARAQIGWAPEEPAVADGLTVREQLTFAARLRGLSRREVTAQLGSLLSSLDLTSVEARLCGALSRGTRRRVGLAMALLGQPRVLLLDEPTAGLDPAQVAALRALLLQKRQEGVAILLSSHVVAELEGLIDDVVVLARGRTVCAVDRAALSRAVAAVAADGAPNAPGGLA